MDRAVTPPGRIERALGSNAAFAAVLALAAVLRVAHVFALRRLPLFDRLILDSEFYDGWARQLAAGNWIGGPLAFFFDPLYPYALGATYRLFGHDLLLVRLLQAALGVGTCALTAVLARRAAGRLAGNVAALLVALYAPAVFQEGEIEKTALGVFLAAATLVLVTGRTRGTHLAAGACLGLAALCRGNLVLLAPVLAAFLALTPFEGGWRQRLSGAPGRSALLFLLGCALAIAPVTWRNHHVSGEWILTTASAGANFYIGNNPANTSGAFQNVPFVRPQSAHEEEDFRAQAESRTGRRMTQRELSSYWFGQAWSHVVHEPAFAAAVAVKKLVLFGSNLELPDAWDMYFLERWSPVLAIPLGMGLLLPLAGIGAAARFRASREVRLLMLFVLAYTGSVALFFVFSRFRLYLVPALAVLAALGVLECVDAFRARASARLWRAGAIAVPLALFSFFGVGLLGLRPEPHVQSLVNLAEIYQERNDVRAAAALLDEAYARHPERAVTSFSLGKLHLRSGDAARAAGEFERALAIDPNYPDAWLMLGLARDAQGDTNRALSCYLRQLELVPSHAEAARRVAEIRIRTGALEEGIEGLTKAALNGADGPDVRLTLAAALVRAGRAAEAQAVLEQSKARGWPSSKADFDREWKRLFGS